MRRRSFFLPISKRFSLVVSTLCHVRLKYTSQHSKQQLSIFPTHAFKMFGKNVIKMCGFERDVPDDQTLPLSVLSLSLDCHVLQLGKTHSCNGCDCLAATGNVFFLETIPVAEFDTCRTRDFSLFKWFRSWSQKNWFCKKIFDLVF